MTLGLALLDA